jgi:hypothetical protein
MRSPLISSALLSNIQCSALPCIEQVLRCTAVTNTATNDGKVWPGTFRKPFTGSVGKHARGRYSLRDTESQWARLKTTDLWDTLHRCTAALPRLAHSLVQNVMLLLLKKCRSCCVYRSRTQRTFCYEVATVRVCWSIHLLSWLQY